MTIRERRKYLRLMQSRYKKASRADKGQLLEEMESVTGMHRKTLIRLLNSDLKRKPRRTQRGRTYGVKVQYAVGIIRESVDYICAERMHPNLVWLAEHLARHNELELDAELRVKLSKISPSSLERVIRRIERDQPRLPRPSPQTTNRVAREVPISRIDWDEKRPGHFEVDLVHHSGPVASGHYVHSLQMIDVATGLSERVATLGRSYLVMRDGFSFIRSRLPMEIREIHSDNGGEFLNDHMLRFWQDEVGNVELSRGRPRQSNDQPFVEQKNSTLIRAYLGRDRLDTVSQTNLLNRLYDKMWLFYNLFQPVMRLKTKTTITDQGGKLYTKRSHDQAMTPLDRLIAIGALSHDKRCALEKLRDKTNPRRLREDIYSVINELFRLPCASPESRENVYQTLLMTDNDHD